MIYILKDEGWKETNLDIQPTSDDLYPQWVRIVVRLEVELFPEEALGVDL